MRPGEGQIAPMGPTKDLQQEQVDLLAPLGGLPYVAVAANSADQALGAAGAAGDYLSHLLITPLTLSPGAVSVKDGAGAAITLFAGGAGSVGALVPFPAPLGAKSANGGWSITTGADVQAVALGKFS